jgi:hypothetical protein
VTLRLALATVLLCALPASAEPPLEYQVQAAYVSKFLRFVEWPADADRPGGDYVVGVVGNDSFREAMDALDGYEVGDRAVSVRVLRSPRDVPQLHVLVIGPSVRALEFLDAAIERPVLTVSDAAGFNDAGGIVQFVLIGDTIRFEINLASAEISGLKLSSRLLHLARNVLRDWQP